jgi:ketosteroid isomerase-like protein
MQTNTQIVQAFYEAFQKRDHRSMNRLYNDEIVFHDPAFGLLRGEQVKAMWEMLCSNAKDFSLVFGNIKELDHEYCTCEWTAHYTFSKTGRKVVNKIKANMRLANGEIIEHSDAFSLHKWSAQALGFMGWLLGWNRFFQRKIKNQVHRQLIKFMRDKNERS